MKTCILLQVDIMIVLNGLATLRISLVHRTRFCLCFLAVDIWSVGCIMAELLKGKALFPGDDCILNIKCIKYSVNLPFF